MKKARPERTVLRFITSDLELARSVLEYPLKKLDRVAEGVDGSEGTKDFGPLESGIARIPGHEDARELIPDGDREVRKRLVVDQPLIETRPNVLDQPSFEQQGFPFALTLQHIKIINQAEHRGFSRPQIHG